MEDADRRSGMHFAIAADTPVITIDQNGNVSSAVTIVNGGQVTFKVSTYKSGNNQCRITISTSNIGWRNGDDLGDPTIKVGPGSGR
jgi:hypothetical protein